MASTFSNNLQLELIATGEKIDTWGTVLNGNVFVPLDSVLGATLSVAISTADVALTTSQWRNLSYAANGTLTAAVNLIVPLVPSSTTTAVGGIRVIDNQTTGTGTLSAKTAVTGSVALLLPRGRSLVYSNGVSLFFVTDNAAVSYIGSTATFTGIVNFNGAITANSSATFNATSIFNGASIFTGSATFNSTATFSSTSVFNGSVTITGTIQGTVGLALTEQASNPSTASARGTFFCKTDSLPYYLNDSGTALALASTEILISAQTASSSAVIDFTGLDDTYDHYEVIVSSAVLSSDVNIVGLRVGTGGGPTYQTGSYLGNTVVLVGGVSAAGASATGYIAISRADIADVGAAAGENFGSVISFNNPESSSDFMEIMFDSAYSEASSRPARVMGSGRYNVAGAVTAIRLFPTTGTFLSGTFRLYGFRKV